MRRVRTKQTIRKAVFVAVCIQAPDSLCEAVIHGTNLKISPLYHIDNIDLILSYLGDDTEDARKKRRRCTFNVLRGVDDAADKGSA